MNQTSDTLLKAFPTEIICRIFELSITTSCAILQPESTDWYSNLKASSQFSPFHLGAISKAWRNIVWSTPQLWSTIVIKLDSKVFVTSAGYEMVEGWFQRSGCLPLGIRIYERDPTAGLGHRGYFMNQFMSTRYPGYRRADSGVLLPTLEQKSRVLDLVNSYSHRWRVLDVHLPRQLLGMINLKQPEDRDSDNAPAVKNNSGNRVQLDVLRIHQLGLPEFEPRRDPFAHQPKLFSEQHEPRIFRLMNVSIGDMRGVKWTNLVVLFVDTTNTEQLLTVISNAPRLESLEALNVRELYRLEERSVPDRMAWPRTHESLRKIKLKTSSSLDILRRITMPSLISIDLTMNIYEHPRILQPRQRPTSGIVLCLAEFFERSQPPLSIFALEMPNVSIREILDILQTLPSSTLTNLTLGRSLIAPELWTGLFDLFGRPASCTGDALGLGAGGGQMRFPNLREMTLEHMSPEIKLSFMLWDVVADALRDALSGPAAPFLKNLQQLTIIYPTCLKGWETFHGMQAAIVKLGVLVKQDHLPLRFVATQRRE